MKTLLGHLVESNFLKMEKAIEVSIDYLTHSKSLLEIIYEKKLVPTEQLFNAMEVQQSKGVDLKSACMDMGLWTIDLQKQVIQEMQSQEANIVQLLLKDELISIENLTIAYDEYVRMVSKELECRGASVKAAPTDVAQDKEKIVQKAPVDKNIDTSRLSLVDAINQEIAKKIKRAEEVIVEGDFDLTDIDLTKELKSALSEPLVNISPLKNKAEGDYSLETEYELSDDEKISFIKKYDIEEVIQNSLDPGLIFDYFEVLNQENLSELENYILTIEVANEVGDLNRITNCLREIYRTLHTFKGSARFIKAHLVEKIIHYGENVLEICQRFLEQINSKDIDKLVGSLLKVLDVIRGLNKAIDEYSTEQAYWEAEETNKTYLNTLLNLELFLNYLDTKNLKVDLDQLEEAF